MAKEVRIGLIGGGWMGKAHTTAFHNAKMIFGDDMPVFELVSDVNEEAVKAFAENMGYKRYTTNWRDVVTDPDVDLVDVATPNVMHFEMAKAALENGKHVFCEKPLSLTAAESRILADLAKEKAWMASIDARTIASAADRDNKAASGANGGLSFLNWINERTAAGWIGTYNQANAGFNGGFALLKSIHASLGL